MSGRINQWVLAVMVVIGMMGGFTELGLAQVVTLYDDFGTPRLNPDKWRGNESFSPSGINNNPNREAERRIQGGRLRLVLTTHGDLGLNSGRRGGRYGVVVTNPDPITTMQARVIIKNALVQNCGANTSASRARAQLFTRFFNDGSSSGEGDRLGDIGAGIQMHRDAAGGDQIVAFISRCITSTCGSSETLDAHLFDKTWIRNEPNTLRVRWQPGKDRFNFVVDPGANSESVNLSYNVSDTDAPVSDFKRIAISNSAENCPNKRKRVSMTALIDDVKLNPGAVP